MQGARQVTCQNTFAFLISLDHAYVDSTDLVTIVRAPAQLPVQSKPELHNTEYPDNAGTRPQKIGYEFGIQTNLPNL